MPSWARSSTPPLPRRSGRGTVRSGHGKERMGRMGNIASSPFAAMKIVECGQGVSAAFGAKLLADLGAEVIKVEPPEGDLTRGRGPFPPGRLDPEKSGTFIYLNTNKRGVVLDLRRAEGQQLLSELLNRADVLLHNMPPSRRSTAGLDSAALHARHPRLIVAAISIFGESGSYA